MNSDCLVIVPVFNEQKNILKTINNLKEFFENIIVINDGSNDETQSILSSNSIPFLSHIINLGQGAALETGLNFFINMTDFNYVITFDGDGQHLAKDAYEMFKYLKKESHQIVVGNRFKDEEAIKEIPLLKRIVLNLAIKYERIFYSIKLNDSHNGLRVLTRKIVSENILPIKNNDMAHATEIVYKASKVVKNIPEFKINIKYNGKRSQPPINAINIVTDNLLNKL